MASIDAENVRLRHEKYLVPATATYYDQALVVDRGDGCYLYDVEGAKYLDFFGGILTVSVGHAHPRVVEAVSDQVSRVAHTSALYINPSLVDLAERLAAITPGDLQQSYFTASGTEANETAVAMARLATGSHEVVGLRHSYSGRSQLGMTLTGQAPWRLGTTGLAGIHHAHNAYCYRCPFGQTPDKCHLECAQDLEEMIATSTSGRIAAFIAEPIQGVGGFITPPEGYFEEAVGIVRRHGGLFIADEVQTGFGRTGRMFGIEHYGVVPDIMTFAKGLANGSPIGATVTTAAIGAHYRGPSISTFGGNPMSMRAALATLDVIADEGLVENARVLGQVLRDGLEEISREFAVVGDVRGKGLMQALEFVRDYKKPAPDLVLAFFEATRRRGLLIGKGGLYGNTVRITPPLSVSRSQVMEALDIIREAIAEIYQAEPGLRQVVATH